MAVPGTVDYGRIETGWREGIKSVPQLAAEYTDETGQTITQAAIRKHFVKLGIPRDLSAKIKAKADAMVSAATVSGSVSVDGNETLPAEAAIIASAATTSANVQLSHRADIRKLRERVQGYETELDACQDDLGKRVTILKNLVDTQCRLIAAEREAFGMDKDAPPEQPLSRESLATLRRLKAQLGGD